MKFSKYLIVALSVLSVSGCKTFAVEKPKENNIDAGVFTIIVPKDLNNPEGLLKGVKFPEFRAEQNYSKGKFITSSSLNKFISGTYEENPTLSELKTSFCTVVRASSGRGYTSCEIYSTKVKIDDMESKYEIELKPYRLKKVQGRDPLFMPIEFPGIDIDKYFTWMTNEKASFNVELTSNYPVESLKGNFDRALGKLSVKKRATIDAALKQFKDLYKFSMPGKVDVYMGAQFFPYKNGSLVKLTVKAIRDAEKGVMSIDWVEIKSRITDKINSIVNL